MERLENITVNDAYWAEFESKAREVEVRKYIQCDCCGEKIYEDSRYYEINGDVVCKDCVKEYVDDVFGQVFYG